MQLLAISRFSDSSCTQLPCPLRSKMSTGISNSCISGCTAFCSFRYTFSDSASNPAKHMRNPAKVWLLSCSPPLQKRRKSQQRRSRVPQQTAVDAADDTGVSDLSSAPDPSCKAAAATAESADLAQLTAMGFDRSRALDALQESNFNVEAATNWLLTNVV